MSRKNTTRQTVQTLVVGNTASIATISESLVGSGDAYNITAGQITVLAAGPDGTRPDLYKISAADVTGVDTIYLAQGTDTSNTMSAEHTMKVGKRSLVKTDKIKLSKVRYVASRKPELGTYQVEKLVLNGAAVDEALYTAKLNLRSTQFNHTHNSDNGKWLAASHGTGLSATAAEIYNGVGTKLNFQSELAGIGADAPFVTFGLAASAVAGSTLLSTVTEGMQIPFLVDGTTTYSYTVTKDFVNTFTKLHVAGTLLNTQYLVATNSTTNPAITGLIVIGLDHQPMLGIDLEPRVKVGVRLSFGNDGTISRLSGAFEGSGKASTLSLTEQERSLLQVNNFNFYPSLSHNVNTTSYIGSGLYTETNIEHYDTAVELTAYHEWEKNVKILWPATITNPAATVGTPYTITTTSSGALAAFNAIMAPWLNRNSEVKYVGDAVKALTIVA
jgi:hypothetical protein